MFGEVQAEEADVIDDDTEGKLSNERETSANVPVEISESAVLP